ncbi:MAG: TonB-dependent receptor plug domain-containing protein, partial [Bacteroidales bacterium]|nr:TonB-dependent receptor plug domain-containing protein [Bacteroidales bacterium]
MALLFFCSWQIIYAQVNITGKVTDAKDGMPLPGVNIQVKGTSVGTITDFDGNYIISASSGQVLEIKFIGYLTQEISIGSETTYDVVLEVSEEELGEVVVTALGISKEERSLGYAATTVSSLKLTEVGTPNLGTALYGKVPGLRVAATPGGATSGVAIQIRGVNSITGKTTPLVVMDGVPIRDGNFSNTNYWNDQRIRSNGLVDINPEDIESVTVLKGASAAALYGSEAVNGVLLITTKSGKGKKGFSVDFSANYSIDKLAYQPRWQKERGAGFDPAYEAYATDENGFTEQTLEGQTYRALPQAGLNFGPKFDGQPILCWDGKVRPYEYQEDGYANLFQTGHNSTFNVAITNNSEKTVSRFSYTFQRTEGLSIGSQNDKHNFNINNTFVLGDKVTANVTVNYMNWKIHNRPYMIDRMINNFGGMFPSFDNGDWYKEKYSTSLGYRFVQGTNQSLTPNENIIYPNFRSEIADYMWRIMEYNTDEYNNRLNAVVRATWEIAKGLSLQARGSTDYTSVDTQDKRSTEKPLAYGPTGYYGRTAQIQTLLYGDVLLTYKKQLTDNFELSAMAGYNARTDKYITSSSWTDGGLSVENKFDLSASQNLARTQSDQTYFISDAVFG